MIGLGRPSHSKATRHPRQSSAAFLEVFDANQLATMRELFHFLDQDSDGCITKQDLLAVFQSFGKVPTDSQLNQLLRDPQLATQDERINLSAFISLFAERLSEGFDSEGDLNQAFATLDRDDTGLVPSRELRALLLEANLSDKEIDTMLQPPFVDRAGNFNYRLFSSTIRIAEQED